MSDPKPLEKAIANSHEASTHAREKYWFRTWWDDSQTFESAIKLIKDESLKFVGEMIAKWGEE